MQKVEAHFCAQVGAGKQLCWVSTSWYRFHVSKRSPFTASHTQFERLASHTKFCPDILTDVEVMSGQLVEQVRRELWSCAHTTCMCIFISTYLHIYYLDYVLIYTRCLPTVYIIYALQVPYIWYNTWYKSTFVTRHKLVFWICQKWKLYSASTMAAFLQCHSARSPNVLDTGHWNDYQIGSEPYQCLNGRTQAKQEASTQSQNGSSKTLRGQRGNHSRLGLKRLLQQKL